MVVILGAMAYFIMTVYDVYRATLLAAQSDRTATALMTQLMRETKNSVSIDGAASSFGVTNGMVSLNTADEFTKSFSLIDGQVRFDDGSGAVAVTPESVNVSRFLLTQITTPVSQAVHYDIGISYQTDDGTETRYYDGVAILRQSYE